MTSIAELKKKRAARKKSPSASKSKGKMPMKGGKPAFLTPGAEGPIYDTPRGKRRAKLEDKETLARKKAVKLSKRGAKVAEAGGDRSKLDKRSARQNEKAVKARGRLNKMDERNEKRISRTKRRMEQGKSLLGRKKGTGAARKAKAEERAAKGKPSREAFYAKQKAERQERVKRTKKVVKGPTGRGPKVNNRGTTMSRPNRGGTMKKAAVRRQARKTRRRIKKA